MEMALAKLTHAGLASRWWAEAVNTAVFILNRVLHTAKNIKTPIEMFTGHAPNLANMKVFGCKCFNMIKAPEKRNKLAPKATLCIMPGYMDSIKAYKLYDVEAKKVTHGVHVKFSENEFFGEDKLPRTVEDSDDEDEDENATTSNTLYNRAIGSASSILQSAARGASSTIRTARNFIDKVVPASAPPAQPCTTTLQLPSKRIDRSSSLPDTTPITAAQQSHFKRPPKPTPVNELLQESRGRTRRGTLEILERQGFQPRHQQLRRAPPSVHQFQTANIFKKRVTTQPKSWTRTKKATSLKNTKIMESHNNLKELATHAPLPRLLHRATFQTVTVKQWPHQTGANGKQRKNLKSNSLPNYNVGH
ncbi:hypothetical protein AeMF1_019487 [Aphanomyces euteiches]|nr:hypothetical protein AeMF1_019487 [Aphanomyces euteiches]KAH9186500.1 hypothetical protein AeNC1_011525 [Aphanomyces euteiches]